MQGKGSPNLFFALFEESCKLLNPKGFQDLRPIRLQWNNQPGATGALVESYPENVKRAAGITGYLYLPVITIFTVLGFSRLLNFNLPTSEMPYSEFLSLHLFEYLLEVAFGIGLIMTGLYFAEWAKNFSTAGNIVPLWHFVASNSKIGLKGFQGNPTGKRPLSGLG